MTLGLPFIRTSPVHGTAFEIVGTGRADPSSMEAAIRMAARLAVGRFDTLATHICFPRSTHRMPGSRWKY